MLRSIKQGGSEWAYRYVTLCFAGSANGWGSLYPFQGSQAPYFDFMYGANEDPQQVLAALLESQKQPLWRARARLKTVISIKNGTKETALVAQDEFLLGSLRH
ncbi:MULTISPECIES: hypothetical protein [unclassified Pseudomonas]|uniref:hypothetical protein n=1 Tax=unclassified Pseudomonas TaxID=196821 RepID=UPI00147FDF2D|nr:MULTISPECIES: hypothetical protein [unclassified Pseudomonas]